MTKKTYLIVAAIALPLFGLAYTADYYHSQYNELNHKVQQVRSSAANEPAQIDYVNSVRKAHNLPELKYDDGLIKAARAKVEDMIKNRYFQHETPDKKPFYDLLFKVRPGLKYYGENIGRCYTAQESMFKAYEASEGHLRNILDPRYTLFGGYTQWDESQRCFVNANEFGG